MANMTLRKLAVQDAFEITSTAHSDERGLFYRAFCEQELNQYLPQPFAIKQSNISFTQNKGTVRGLHFQHPPHAEAKLVGCLQGQVYDVIVDLRPNSPTFKQWSAVTLNSDLANMVYIPKGCAHGFQALTDNVLLLYFHDEYYQPEAEDGIHVNDSSLNIPWPLTVSYLSPRDQQHSCLAEKMEA